MKTKVNVMKKVLGFVLTLVIMCGMLPMTSNAAEGTTVYLNPGPWDVDSAWFAVYYFGGSGSATWAVMESENGNYKATIPTGYTTVIFCRMNKDFSKETVTNAPTDNHWSGKWDQTADLPLPTSTQGCKYTVTGWPSEATDWKSPGTWGHAYTDGVCTLCGYEEGIGAKLAGYSLSVDGKIGVNFYMELDEAVTSDGSAKMQFTLPDGTTPEVAVTAAKTETIGTKTYHIFTCEVAAKEMASDIKAKIVTSTAEGTEYTYTVRDYADALIARSTSDAEKAFVKAMLNYGASSQTYFNFNASDLANKNLAEGDKAMPAGASIAESLATNYAAVTTGTLGTFKSNLILNSETTLKVYFTPAVGVEVESIKVDETPVELVKSGDDYVVAIEDINATEIDSVKTITVTAADATTTTLSKCSPLAYGYSVLNANDREALSNVIVALRLYNQAADAYVGN